jgi:hypothetical protein
MLIALAIAVAAFPMFRPNGTVDLGPLDLRAGSSREATFSVGYAAPYNIGVEMNQRVAKQLFPCTADPDAFSLHHDICARPDTKVWPIRLSLRLTANESDVSQTLKPDGSTGGGEYGGSDTYTWSAALTNMRPGIRYRLSFRSLGDGTALLSAKPRLVVSDADPAFGDEQALIALAAYAAATLLTLGALIWLGVGFWLSRRAHAPKAGGPSGV